MLQQPHITGLSGAAFSADKKHRFALWRIWNPRRPTILFIGLNPSRANEFYNDPTIKRCISFSKSWGYGRMLFGNLFSLRSPYPEDVAADPDAANHLQHNEWILYMSQLAHTVVFCWGSWDFIEKRKYAVIDLVRIAKQPKCFGLNKDGNPKHPLYLKSTSTLIDFPTKPLLV